MLSAAPSARFNPTTVRSWPQPKPIVGCFTTWPTLMPPVFYFCFCFSSGVDSVSVLTIQNAILKYKRSIELKRKDCEQLTIKLLKVEYKVNGLEKLLSEKKWNLRASKSGMGTRTLQFKVWHLGFKEIFQLFTFFFFNRLHTQRGAWTHNYEIKSHMLCQLSQPGTPWNTYFYAADV